MSQIMRVISLGVVVAWASGLIGFLVTQDTAYMLLSLGLLFTEFLVRALHTIPVSANNLLARPMEAMNCSGFNRGGPCGGTNGMPSGHVAMTTLAVLGPIIIESLKHKVHKAWYIAAALVIFAMAASRVALKCHTVLQVIAGAVLGCLLAIGFYLALHNLRK